MDLKFNNITVTGEERKKLFSWLKYYHRLQKIYEWKYKTLKKKFLVLRVSGAVLIVAGSIAGGITANPIVLGAVAGPGIVLEEYLNTSKLQKNLERSHFAYTSYKKITSELRNSLWGYPYDEAVFLSNCAVIDSIVIDSCPPIDLKYERKYDKKYEHIHRTLSNSRGNEGKLQQEHLEMVQLLHDDGKPTKV